MYLLMPDRFANGDPANDDPAASKGLLDRTKSRYYHGGDLRGVIDRLPYLKDLGVTAIWLNPWYDNVNHPNERETYDGQAITDYHGYGAVDFYAVEERLGDLATLREMVDRAHAVGIKVIQDQVANHSGPYHPWVKDSPTPTWYYGTQEKHLANTWQTWTLQDPYSTPEMRKATLEGWFIDILPDFDQDDPEVARYTIQNTLWWVGVSGLDGIRQDTLPYVHRRFWKEWMAAIKKEYPDLRVVGELLDGDPTLVSFFQGGVVRYDGLDSGVDTLFDFPTYFEVREAFARGGSLRKVAMMLARDHLYRDASSLVTLLGLHDVPRFMGEPGARVDSLKSAFTFLATARGIPLVYYGDEIALPGGGDPDNRRDFPGGFQGDARNAFEAGGTDRRRGVGARARAGAAASEAGDAGTAPWEDREPARRRPQLGLRPGARRPRGRGGHQHRRGAGDARPAGGALGPRGRDSAAGPGGIAGRGGGPGGTPAPHPAAGLIGGIHALGQTIPLISLLSFMKFRDD